MRVPEEIKLGLEACHSMKPHSCEHCPYRPAAKCSEFLGEDAVQYIRQLEMRVEELENEQEED
jgi:hypothetical protein